MATVAEQLRHARESRNLTIQEVSEITKIRTDHLRALEEGKFDVFSAPVYIRGFVRSYAMLLKLHLPGVMKQLEEELGESSVHAEPPSLTGEREGIADALMVWLAGVDWKRAAMVLGVLVVIVAILVGVALAGKRTPSDPTAGVKPGLYAPKKTTGGQTLPVPSPTNRAGR